MNRFLTRRPVRSVRPAPPDVRIDLAPPGPPRRLQPQNAAAIERLALQLHRGGHLDEARRLYEELLELRPDHPALLHLLGVLHHQQGNDQVAIALLERAATLEDGNPAFLRDLGEVYRALARFDEAVASLRRALALADDDTDTLCNLGHAYLAIGRHRSAEVCYRRAARALPRDADVLCWLGTSLMLQGKRRAAGTALRRALVIDPDHAEAVFLDAAISGRTLTTAPASYVRSLFDGFAPTFDEQLTGRLGYAAPAAIRAAVDRFAPESRRLRVADLGCGTGLAGAALADRCEQLDGVDLSPRMLQRAAAHACYDQLVEGDLHRLLRDEPTYDLLVAADVFIYVGALDATFAATRRALANDGAFVFTTEEHAGDGVLLQTTARFAHGRDYVRRLAAEHGFQVREAQGLVLRYERRKPIGGTLWVLMPACDAGASAEAVSDQAG